MNERDSEASAAALINAGLQMTKIEEEADVLLFNTCSVRDQAERKAIGKIGIIKKLKRRRPHILIGILGCMAQSRKDDLLVELPHVDFVIGTDQLYTLVEVVKKELNQREKIVNIDIDDKFDSLEGMEGHLIHCKDDNDNETPLNLNKNDHPCSAYVSLMRGCNRFCSYCIVPYVRGREKSRSTDLIIKECEKLVSAGVKEVMLLGQNVAAFGLEKGERVPKPGFSPFADLLESINDIEGLARIRFTSPHPSCFNDKLIETVTSLPKVCNNIHLPLQSGSDKILELMGRGYTANEFMKIVNSLKERDPDITFSTDIIVGFPGETNEDFLKTRAIFNEVEFNNAFIFKYSPRRGTKAAKIADSVPMSDKEERNGLLLQDLKRITTAYNKAQVGKTLEVMVEGVSKRNKDKWFSRTTSNQVVIFSPYKNIKSGDITNIHIERSTSMTLFGDVAKK